MMQSYNKKEKLKSKKVIDEIFKSGKSILEFPLKLYYLPIDESSSFVQFGVSVPKKNIKKAINRNLLKRRIREAYRLNRSRLLNEGDFHDRKFALLIVYLEKEELDFHTIEKKIISLFHRFKAINGKNI